MCSVGGAGAERLEQRPVLVGAAQLEEIGHGEQRRRQLELDVAAASRLGDGDQHGGRALLQVVAPPQRQAPGQLGGGDQLRIAVGLGDGRRLAGQLVASRRIGGGDENRRQHAAHADAVAPLVGGQGGDRLLHQVDELAIGGLADVEADARQRRHPALGGSGQEHRLARRPAPARAASRAAATADGPIALGTRRVTTQQRQLGPVTVVDLVGDERVDALDPRRGVLVGADVERAPSRRQPGADPHVAFDQRSGLQQVVGEHRRGRSRLARQLDRRGDAAVQVEPAGPPDARPDRLTDQGVRHGQAAGAVLDQQPGGDGGVRGVEELIALQPAGRRRGRATSPTARRRRPG